MLLVTVLLAEGLKFAIWGARVSARNKLKWENFYLLVLWPLATVDYLSHSNLAEQSRKGSLFSLFLFNPLVAFCYVCSIADLRSDLWDSCQRQVRRIMNDSLRVFYDWSRYVGESRCAWMLPAPVTSLEPWAEEVSSAQKIATYLFCWIIKLRFLLIFLCREC